MNGSEAVVIRSPQWKSPHRTGEIVLSFISIGEYRRDPMNLIIERFEPDLSIYAGRYAPDRSIRTLGASDIRMSELRTLVTGRAIFQFVPLKRYLGAAVLVVDLNPNAVHLWPLLVLRRLMNKPTVVWGHAWPRKGPSSRTVPVRRLMTRIAASVIVYTRTQADELRQRSPGLNITVAPNSLYRAVEYGFDTHTERTNFAYVGRLVDAKKVKLLIDAFSRIASAVPAINLVIVGDGPNAHELQELVVVHGLCDRIEFRGHIGNLEDLRSIYSTTIASISPGYVGLSATQSFTFGVPMLVADNEPHAPEIEAVKEGFNARFFSSDSVDSLAAALVSMVRDAHLWHARGRDIAVDCRDSYSAEAMATGVISAILDALQ
ncbi:glycosyltransferase [Mycolicibacterium vanbaalenii]|uniref:glycosyltransferase n=1 Tax=Mycolicibacterium vanbaalenii TaxID=110539 RepID=UPI001F2D717D|nr:glycosyltransferase [Mycolicibacterium vanbaalenii]UJL31496.1 glycosyltransferase [Mycolicibacterium vanbaalenii]WND58344.1 glycosyltransferase [Mycolicibacterium vanbaalenii]